MPGDEIDRLNYGTRRTIIVLAFLTPTLLSLGLIVCCVIMYMRGVQVPDELRTLAAAGMGYLYGALPGLVKDFIALAPPPKREP